LGYIPLLALHQVLEGLPDYSVLLLECLFNSIQNPAISGDHSRSVGIGMRYILLLECDAPSTNEGAAMKKKIIKK